MKINGYFSVLTLGLIVLNLNSCASLNVPSKIPLKSFQTSSPVLVRDLGAFTVAPDWSGDLYQEKRVSNSAVEIEDSFWTGRGVIGSPPQSYIAPQFIENNRLLVGGIGTGLAAFDFGTGKTIWRVDVSRGLGAQPFVLAPYVYASFMDATVKKIDINSGEIIWSKKLDVESTGGVVVAKGLLFATFADNTLWALDEKTGAPVWNYKRPTSSSTVIWSLRGASDPHLSPDGSKVLAGFSDGSFVALASSTGDIVWEKSIEQKSELFKDLDLGPVLSETGQTAYIGQVDGDLLSVDVSSGRVLWKSPAKMAFPPFLDRKFHQIWVSSTKGQMIKIAEDTGNILAKLDFSSKGLLTRVTPFSDSFMIATWTKGSWSLHDRNTGKLIWEDSTAINSLAPVAVDDQRVALLSTRNKLHMFAIEKTSESSQKTK